LSSMPTPGDEPSKGDRCTDYFVTALVLVGGHETGAFRRS
jgi:hypothetical protein